MLPSSATVPRAPSPPPVGAALEIRRGEELGRAAQIGLRFLAQKERGIGRELVAVAGLGQEPDTVT
jgi:hypothetical protein